MDINYLFHRQQVERSRMAAADGDKARLAHAELARRYEQQIKQATDGSLQFRESGESDEEPPPASN